MNQVQRKFLIERIQKKVNEKIYELEKEKLGHPSASNFIFKAALNGELQLQDSDTILAAIKKMALDAKEGSNWLSGDRMGVDKETTVKIKIVDLLRIPEDYKEELNRVVSHNSNLNAQIKELKLQLETIEVRIQLASDKTLANLINEVDDMGDLSLIDTKIKLLN